MDILGKIRKTLKEEAKAILNIEKNLDEKYISAVDMIYNCKGKVVVTGIGKSGLIGKKIAATLASTGTPAFFMHSSDALHGDSGMINKDDIVMAISNSGESEEVLKIIPAIKRLGVKIITITNNTKSRLAEYSDITLGLGVKREADPLDLVPTTTTTATLAIGDAVAIALLSRRNFKPEDFAMLHPGGSLGKKLLLKVDDVMHKGEENPVINENAFMKEVIIEITSKRLGAVDVTDESGELVGIITDGDLRRALEKYGSQIFDNKAREIMTKDPVRIEIGRLGTEAVHLMEDRPSQIMVLPVVDKENRPVGMVRIHDLIKAGIV